MVADFTARRVVAVTLKLGNSFTAFDHLEVVDFDVEIFSSTFDFESKAGRKVLLVADHDVDIFAMRRFTSRALMPADRFPEDGR